MSGLGKLLEFLNKLEEYGFEYTLEHSSEDAVSVLIGVPGERWEIDFFRDGHLEVEVFYSGAEDDQLEGEEALERLFVLHEDEFEDDDDFEDDEDDDDEDFDEDDEDFDDEDDIDYEEDDDLRR